MNRKFIIWPVLCLVLYFSGIVEPASFLEKICKRVPSSSLCQPTSSDKNLELNSNINATRADESSDIIPNSDVDTTAYYCQAFRPTYRFKCQSPEALGMGGEPFRAKSRKKRAAFGEGINRLTYDIKQREMVCDHYKEYYRVNCSDKADENKTVKHYCDLYREICSSLEEDKQIVAAGGKLTLRPEQTTIVTTTPVPATTTAAATTAAAAPPPGFNFGIKVPVMVKKGFEQQRKKYGKKRKFGKRLRKDKFRDRARERLLSADTNPHFCSYFEAKCHISQAYDAGLDPFTTLCHLFAFTEHTFCPDYTKLELRLGCAQYRKYCMIAPQYETIEWAIV